MAHGLYHPLDDPRPEERYDIRILKDGTWLHNGSPIGRKNLVALFAQVLRRDGDGNYWLVTPAERGRIAVEDAPFTAVECRSEGSGAAQTLHIRTNLDAWVALGPEHPLRSVKTPDNAPALYIAVRGGLEARITRAVYYALVEHAEADADTPNTLGVWSGGVFFPIGQVAP